MADVLNLWMPTLPSNVSSGCRLPSGERHPEPDANGKAAGAPSRPNGLDWRGGLFGPVTYFRQVNLMRQRASCRRPFPVTHQYGGHLSLLLPSRQRAFFIVGGSERYSVLSISPVQESATQITVLNREQITPSFRSRRSRRSPERRQALREGIAWSVRPSGPNARRREGITAAGA
jgi:hypothetical protein